MRTLIQRVSKAVVEIDGMQHASVNKGLLVFLGIEGSDTDEDIAWLTGKLLRLRIFNDNNGVMNQSVSDIEGAVLVVSQFTLHASTKKGNRPSYIRAAEPAFAETMYQKFIMQLKELCNLNIQTGKFAADMKINLVNDGPVTIMIDSKNKE
jgi:D-aminoacyl-tRNA deacylase